MISLFEFAVDFYPSGTNRLYKADPFGTTLSLSILMDDGFPLKEKNTEKKRKISQDFRDRSGKNTEFYRQQWVPEGTVGLKVLLYSGLAGIFGRHVCLKSKMMKVSGI